MTHSVNSRLIVQLLALASTAACLCFAQQPPNSHRMDVHQGHTARTEVTIVGPEQIPDSLAFALFLDMASQHPNSAVDEKARQRAYLLTAGITEQELATVAETISQFCQQMTTSVNSATSTANQISVQHDALVATTMSALAARLSTGTMTRLQQFIQSEKSKMNVASVQK